MLHRSLLPLTVLTLVAVPASAEVKLADVFTSGAVLQRDAAVLIFGTADAGEEVTVEIAGQTVTGKAGDDGRWRVDLEPLQVGDPLTMTVSGEDNEIELDDLLVGDVWICGGQSNMEWTVRNSNDADAEIAAADFPEIRLFDVPHKVAAEPTYTIDARWQSVTPQSIPTFSAIGYFFGRELHREAGVPIGLISSNWGGTLVEAWMGESTLRDGGFDALIQRREQLLANGSLEPAPQPRRLRDTNIRKQQWANTNLDVSAWGTGAVPGPFLTEQADLDGAVWYRRTVDIPADLAGKAMTLRLGQIDDADVTFFNGKEVGRTSGYLEDRAYEVPAELVKAGQNAIAVRVFDEMFGGGFTSEPDVVRLEAVNGGAAIPLAGEWRVAAERVVARDVDELTGVGRSRPQDVPTALYNGMITPLSPYAVRGFLWYQGESNASNAAPYADWLRGMIAFDGPDAQPFYIVQLAGFRQRSDDPAGNDNWAQLRAQQDVVSRDENNGMATAIDIGDANDIHPRNKQEVGRRLALLALRDVYGKDVVATGPMATKAMSDGSAVVVEFDAADGLKLDGETEHAFAVGDGDGNFVWAKPTVDGQSVRLSFDGLAGDPTVVRYAWQINPPTPLRNGAGLPAIPFELKIGQ